MTMKIDSYFDSFVDRMALIIIDIILVLRGLILS